jgi:CDP-4-dehydro-6-deoxyglucose reductase
VDDAAMGASNVIIDNTGERYACGAGDMVLVAGLAAGLRLPPACGDGTCGACKALVLSGDVAGGAGPALTEAEAAQGFCLTCRARPASPRLHLRLLAEIAPMHAAPAIRPVELTAEVIATTPVTPSIREVVLALPPAPDFAWQAGMHVEFVVPRASPNRVYSMVNAPGPDGRAAEGLLRFYVTRHEGGLASGWLHDRLQPGASIELHGPHGDFTLPPEAMDAGFVALAGGSGLAPVLALAERALADGCAEDIELLLSVRTLADVYARDRLHGLATRFANFRYAIAITRETAPDGAAWRTGRLPDLLAGEALELAAKPVFIAGPPEFVAACEVAATALGALDSQLKVESFLA